MAIFQDLLRRKIEYTVPGLQTGDLIDALRRFPPSILPPRRQRREAITNVLAGHEMFKPTAGNARLFLRLRRGYYVFNPDLEIEVGEDWVNVYTFIGLDQMAADGGKDLRYFRDVLRTAREDFARGRGDPETPAPAPPPAGPAVAGPASVPGAEGAADPVGPPETPASEALNDEPTAANDPQLELCFENSGTVK